MNSKDIHNLQEAYNQVYQVDEAEKWIQKAIEKPGALSKQLGVPEDENIPADKLAAAAKKGGKLGKRARLAMTLKGFRREEIDLYDIIFTHLLDEGYADTEQAASVIMVNMSEEWRESIVENVSSGRSKVRNVKQRVSSAEVISNTQKQDKIAQHFADHAAKKKAAGDEAHSAATKAGKSPSDAETARQRAHRQYEKEMRG